MTRDSLRRAARTFLQTALALLLPGLFGWLNSLTEWARAEGQTPFPDARSLAYLGVVAIVSGVVAAVTLVWNGIEDATGHGLLRNVTAPQHRRGDTGAIQPRTAGVLAFLIPLVILIVVLVVLL